MFIISCHWTSNEHRRLHFVSLTNVSCELEGLSENHCSLKATCADRDTNTFECITLESRLYVNCKPPHALYFIQNTKPVHSHSPTHTTNRGDTVNHFTFNLTFSRLSVYCNTEETINFTGEQFFFPSTNQRRQKLTFLYNQSITCAHCAVSIQTDGHTEHQVIQTSTRQHTFVFPSLLTPGGPLLIFQYLQISPNCSSSQIFTTGPSGAYANDCTTTEPNVRF